MSKGQDLWLPRGFVLPDGAKISALLSSGKNWQIVATSGKHHLLITTPELVEKWSASGFLDAFLFAKLIYGDKTFSVLSSLKSYALAAVDGGQAPNNKSDALAFATALKASRERSAAVSFADAIYVEQYSCLLPCWTGAELDDEILLGIWLTGGVGVSARDFRRLNQLVSALTANDLKEVIAAAGLPPSSSSSLSSSSSSSSPSLKKHAGNQPARAFKLAGRPQLEAFFNEYIIDIIFNAEKYQPLGIDFPSSVVLHGLPGCGKTYAVEQLIEFLDWPSYTIDSNSIGSPYIHETSKKIAEIFDAAIDNAPAVIVIDEMESFLSSRQSGSQTHHTEEVAEFLRRIPEAIKNRVLIIAMTNLIDMIDPAILRRGRFDHVIEVKMPSREEVAGLLNSLLEKLPTAENLNLAPALDVLTGKALSDSAFVIREAARLTAKLGKTKIDQESIEMALKNL